VLEGPACAVVALTKDTVRCFTEKYLVTIWTPMWQLVFSDHTEWCFLAIIHVTHKILLLSPKYTKRLVPAAYVSL
jgi:hypothetical protein